MTVPEMSQAELLLLWGSRLARSSGRGCCYAAGVVLLQLLLWQIQILCRGGERIFEDRSYGIVVEAVDSVVVVGEGGKLLGVGGSAGE